MSAPAGVLAVISAEVRRRRNSQNSKNRDGQFADADRAGAKAAEMEAVLTAVADAFEQIEEGKQQWDRVAAALGADGDCVDDVFAKADAVAELIEADKEYNAAAGDLTKANHARGSWSVKPLAHTHPAVTAFRAASDRRSAALANMESRK